MKPLDKEKVDKIFALIESLKADKDKRVLNSANIMEMLITRVDDLQEEIAFLKEENEKLRFENEDKKFEHREGRVGSGRRRRTTQGGITQAITPEATRRSIEELLF